MTLLERVQAKLGPRARETHSFRGDDTVVVGPGALLELAGFLRDEAGLPVLSDLAGVDGLHLGWPERFQVVYHFFGYADRHLRRLRVKVSAGEGQGVPTLTGLFRSANWLERECWDQFGIVFEGHPNLERILNHEDFVGHPLRKDYPVDGRHTLGRASTLK